MKRHIQRPHLYSLLFILILFIAAFLRFYCLSCSSLWHDEGNTWALMARSYGEIALAAAADIHPPGYYWLLKAWTTLFGADVWGMRSLSAVLGVATVAVVYAIGRRISDQSSVVGRPSSYFPLLAAFLAAVNPFLIYYSQEARMYALLALESALLFWAAMRWNDRGPQTADDGRRTTDDAIRNSQFAVRHSQFAIYFLAAAAGLWTHYIFPVVIAAAVLAYLGYGLHLRRTIPNPQSPIPNLQSPIPNLQSPIFNPQSPIPFLIANALALLAFLPWLPTAVDRVLSWPAGGDVVSVAEGIGLTVQTLVIGPIRTAPDLHWIWLLLAGIAPILGIWTLRRTPAGSSLGVWLLAPILLMSALGLFSDAFLKFLIIAAPAWYLLIAAVPFAFPKRFTAESAENPTRRNNASSPLRLFASLLLLALSTILAAVTLPGYYADALARDNYAGMARTVAALADPTQDLVILAAPGQRDVWHYYDPGVPVLALPQQRPPDRAATEALLAEVTADRSEIFAIFWALDEADPQGIVERWLDAHAFKGLESWQGNVRFVRYSLPHGLTCENLSPSPQFGDLALLSERCRSGGAESVAAGENFLIGLRWEALAATDRRFKVTIQLLDGRNQVIAQRDGEPGGGSLPSTAWQPGDRIIDNHALFIPPGTPPGEYRLIVALYDGESGARLPVAGGDALPVGAVQVVAGSPLPVDIIPMQQRLDRPLGSLTLVGYDAYRRGYAHAPQTPLTAGDLLHVTLYWQSPDPLPVDWPADLSVTLTLGDQAITAPLAGGLYPTGDWPANAFVRGEFDILYTGGDPQVWVQINGEKLKLKRIPVQE